MVTMQAHDTDTRRTGLTTPTWLVAVAAVLLLALGFGAGFLTSQANQSDPVGLADEATVKIVDDGIRAANAGDEDVAGLARIYTDDAVFFYVSNAGNTLARFEGASKIAEETGGTSGLARTSEVLQQGNLVSFSYTEWGSQGMVLMKLEEGKIATQWVVLDSIS